MSTSCSAALRSTAPRGVHALGDMTELGEDCVELLALPQRQPDLAVAREVTRRGEDQVADARETHERLGSPAEPDAESGDLGQPARHERGARIEAKAETVRDASADGHDVLDGPAHLHPGEVVVK